MWLVRPYKLLPVDLGLLGCLGLIFFVDLVVELDIILVSLHNLHSASRKEHLSNKLLLFFALFYLLAYIHPFLLFCQCLPLFFLLLNPGLLTFLLSQLFPQQFIASNRIGQKLHKLGLFSIHLLFFLLSLCTDGFLYCLWALEYTGARLQFRQFLQFFRSKFLYLIFFSIRLRIFVE